MPRAKTIASTRPTTAIRPVLRDKSNTAVNECIDKRDGYKTNSKQQNEGRIANETISNSRKRQKENVEEVIETSQLPAVPREHRTTRSQRQQIVSRKNMTGDATMVNGEATVFHSSVETPGREHKSVQEASILSNQDNLIAELLELSPSIAEPATPRDDISGSDQIDSAQHTGFSRSTPAVQHSILALKRFKRRPRQPSMLAMVQQSITKNNSTLLNDHTTTYKDNSVFDFDDIEDDLQPDAASTPLNVAKVTRPLAENDISHQTTVAQMQHSSQRARSSRQKRTFEEFSQNAGIDEREHFMPKDVEELGPNDRIPASFENDVFEDVDSEPLRRSLRHQRSSNDIDAIVPEVPRSTANSNNELPHVSVDAGEAIFETQQERLASPTSDQGQSDSESVSMDPVTQRSPSPAEAQPMTRKKVKPLTSADLRSMLPKRRRMVTRVRDVYDQDASDDERDTSAADGDETAYTVAGTRNMSTRHSATEKRAKRTTALREKHKPVPASARRTYARKARNSGKEDTPADTAQIDSESSTTMHDALKSSELLAVRRKFEEIDEWDMEFETITGEDSRKSSQGWR